MSDDQPQDPGRRAALSKLTWAMGGAVAAAAAAPVIVILVEPVGATTVESGGGFVAVGKLEDFPRDTPVAVEIRSPKRDAWANYGEVTIGKAFVIRGAEDVTVFSTICPHKGCVVNWRGEKQSFFCPCHQTIFEKDGSLRTGAAKRGLDALPYEVADGTLRIAFKRFKLGTPDTQPV